MTKYQQYTVEAVQVEKPSKYCIKKTCCMHFWTVEQYSLVMSSSLPGVRWLCAVLSWIRKVRAASQEPLGGVSYFHVSLVQQPLMTESGYLPGKAAAADVL